MHSAIFYVTLPESDSEARRVGGAFVSYLVGLEETKSAKKVGDLVWEVDFQASPYALAILVHAAEQLRLPYSILPLPDAPNWIRASPNQKAA